MAAIANTMDAPDTAPPAASSAAPPAAPLAAPPGAPFLRAGPLLAVPSLHGRSRFAFLVRQAVEQVRPRAIAVELPPTLEDVLRAGIARLPALSVVAYADYDAQMKKVRKIIPITPGDSLVEAVRLGSARGIPVHFIDRDVVGRVEIQPALPDDALLEVLGLEGYWQQAQARLPATVPGSSEALREAEMAARLAQLGAEHAQVLFVCGMAHWPGVRAHLAQQSPPAPAAGAPAVRAAALYNLPGDSAAHALAEMGWEAYAYELARRGFSPQAYPQLLPLPLTRGPDWDAAADEYASTRQQLLALLADAPLTTALPPQAYALLAEMAQNARSLYGREWGEQPPLGGLRAMLRYCRNLALVAGRLAPSRYQFVLAARDAVGDDYAHQALRVADHYPFAQSEEESELPSLQMQSPQAGEAEGETLVLHLRQPHVADEGNPAEDLELPEGLDESLPGNWREQWEAGNHHVSYLPQDARLERFFQFIRNKCRQLLSDQQVRLHRLNASLMDGLDLRESLRNMPLGQLYVRENLPGTAEVGPVVVIFHPPGEEDQHPHQMMWFAEHDWESDLALYSTPPGEKLDGPGISRCRYGGVLSLFPPGRTRPVWGNPRYREARSPAELLLKAAIDQSRKPIVAYVAPQSPPPGLLAQAARKGLRIMHVPLDSLPAELLKRARTFHVLSGRELRPIAPLYIRKR